MVTDQLVETILKSFSQMGVTLVNINFNASPPEYYVQVDRSKLIQSVEDTLKSVYTTLWVLTYGKVNKQNKSNKIVLNYEEVGEVQDENC